MRDFGTRILQDGAIDKDKKVGLAYNGTLNLNPVFGFESYLVSLTYFSDEQEEKRLDYTIGIEYLNEEEQGLPHIFRVYKSQVYFNKKEPSLVIEEIVMLMTEAIYPLEITVDHTGKCTGISNYEEIKKRWPATKNRIKQEYKGEVVSKFIKLFESTIDDPVKLEISVTKEIFWNMFFNDIYVSYGSMLEKDTQVRFPLETNEMPLVYEGISTISPLVTDYNTIELVYEGKAVLPNKSRYYHKRKDHKITSTLSTTYSLDKDTRMPVLIKAVCDIFDTTERKELKAIELLISRQEADKFSKSDFKRKEKVSEKLDVKPRKKKWVFPSFKKK